MIFQRKLVRIVEVHFNNGNLRGLRLTYIDGSRSPLIGSAVQSYRELIFQSGETIVHACLWGNDRSTRTGRIRFTTSRNQVLDVERNTIGQDEFDMNVGSGILAGFFDRHAGDIDENFVHVPSSWLPGDCKQCSIHASASKRFNQTSRPGQSQICERPMYITNQWLFSNIVTRTNSWSWGQSATFNFSHNINVQAWLYRLVRVESNTRWELGLEATMSDIVSQTIDLGWNLFGTLQPGEVILATSTTSHGQADVPYTATVTISAPSSPHTIVY